MTQTEQLLARSRPEPPVSAAHRQALRDALRQRISAQRPAARELWTVRQSLLALAATACLVLVLAHLPLAGSELRGAAPTSRWQEIPGLELSLDAPIPVRCLAAAPRVCSAPGVPLPFSWPQLAAALAERSEALMLATGHDESK